MTTRDGSRKWLSVALIALSMLYVVWFHDDKHALAALLVFALPPLALLLLVWRRPLRAGFWAGVFALFWFCHGIMVAMVYREARWLAGVEIALALVIIALANWPGLKALFRAGSRS
ncbi:MAG: DUF2069 domain-containing protein [Xanthomonadaceae bacterium]|nr:DUF2069 domain-containing protein [Xanthomonadaceae bacterium]